MLIDPTILILAWLAASVIRLQGRQWEHALSRFLLAGMYIYIEAFNPAIEIARLVARYFILLVPVVEIISWTVRFGVLRGKHE